jgi:Icc-related predicted phosphoesterase
MVSDIIRQSPFVINPEDAVVRLDDYHQMVSIGWSNRTPWNSPRECEEDELKTRIDRMMADVEDPQNCILCAHVPPYNTGLDDAPRLTNDLQVKSSMGQVEYAPAGSTAVLDAIKQYGYILGLHGHIHEVHAVKRIDRTVCINPGSEYGEGALHGALVSFNKNKLETYQLVSG